MNDFINRISEYRKAKGLTQKQMADKLAMTQVGYSKIETGKTELTLPKLARIANILEIDLITLLWPDYKEIKDFQKLKDDYSRLKKLNNLLISQIEKDSAAFELIIQYHKETEPLITGLRYLKEGRLIDIINEIKKLNS